MTHEQLIAEIQCEVYVRGLLSHYCGDARRCRGHTGLPDLIIAGRARTAFLEVKTGGTAPSQAQTEWMYRLAAGGENVYLIRERDLRIGRLGEILDRL